MTEPIDMSDEDLLERIAEALEIGREEAVTGVMRMPDRSGAGNRRIDKIEAAQRILSELRERRAAEQPPTPPAGRGEERERERIEDAPRGFVMCAFETVMVPYRHTCEGGPVWIAMGPLGWIGQGSTADAAFDMCEGRARACATRFKEGKEAGSRGSWTAGMIDEGVYRLIARPFTKETR